MVNKIILVGRLGIDPECRTTPQGKEVCRFRMATDSGFGESRKTEWHTVVCFDKQAQFCRNYMRKGSLVYVEGRMTYGSYENKDGVKVNTAEVIANTVQSLGKNDNTGNAGGNFNVAQYDSPSYGGGNSYGGGYGGQTSAPAAPAAEPAAESFASGIDDGDWPF
jgi:single-strand DNA-binding protein